MSGQIPSAAEDCEKLKKAFDGWGTDEATIISILSHRNASKRNLIRETYTQTYGEDLVVALHKEISGDFERAVVLWTLDPPERDAQLVNEAINKKHSCDKFVIMEIACSRSSHDLFLVRQSYIARYNKSIEEDIAHHMSGDFRKLLVSLVSSYRCEGVKADVSLAKSEAKILHDNILAKACNHEELIMILSTRSKQQITTTLDQYRDQFGHDINKDLKENPKDEYLGLLRATIKCLTCQERYYEKVLRLAIKGVGTDEEALTRVIVTRAEVDMSVIKEEYLKKNSETLQKAIEGDTSGDYLNLLLALLDYQNA